MLVGQSLSMRRPARRALAMALLVALAIVGWSYRDTFLSIVRKWADDAAFSHGFLIVPISLWLIREKRGELAAIDLRPSWIGVAALAGLVPLWVVAHGSGVLVIEQFAAVAMLPAMVLALLGPRAAWCLAFPLAFLLFAVPFGRALVPLFMQVTADVATWALRLSGIPIYRSNMYISIPSGSFEVARACSGLNYAITGLVLGVLYAYATYAGWLKRTLTVVAFLLVPILANGLRVYVTIAVSHLTSMRFGPGYEHVTFGRILFVIVILMMFWVGQRWRDSVPQPPGAPVTSNALAPVAWIPAALAIIVAMMGPWLFGMSNERGWPQLAAAAQGLRLPQSRSPWVGPLPGLQGWKPLYAGAIAERTGVYRDHEGSTVDLYVGLYGLGRTAGPEMISFNNRIAADDGNSLSDEVTRVVVLPDRRHLTIRERSVSDAGVRRLVWYWYIVGDRSVVGEIQVKALEALAIVRRDVSSERIVTLSTPGGAGASERLQAFLYEHGACLANGLDTEACE
jgi:exosortase A